MTQTRHGQTQHRPPLFHASGHRLWKRIFQRYRFMAMRTEHHGNLFAKLNYRKSARFLDDKKINSCIARAGTQRCSEAAKRKDDETRKAAKFVRDWRP